VKCESLRAATSVAEQLALDIGSDAPDASARSGTDRVADAVRARFGSSAVRPGTMLDSPSRSSTS